MRAWRESGTGQRGGPPVVSGAQRLNLAEAGGFVACCAGLPVWEGRAMVEGDPEALRLWMRGYVASASQFFDRKAEGFNLLHVEHRPPRDGANWLPVERAFLVAAWPSRLHSPAIGQLLGRSARSVKIQACRSGLSKPAAPARAAA